MAAARRHHHGERNETNLLRRGTECLWCGREMASSHREAVVCCDCAPEALEAVLERLGGATRGSTRVTIRPEGLAHSD